MDPSFSRPLELDKILERLASHAAFSASKELALALTPSPDWDEVERRQQLTHDARRLLELKPGTTIGGARDVRPAAQLATRGGVLTPEQLLSIATTIAAARTLRITVLRFSDEVPALAEMAARIGDLRHVEEAIRAAIAEDGSVVDGASQTLRRLRLELRQAQDRLQAKLHELVTSPALRPYLQDAIVTQREGRWVVPVRADARAHVRGIVHDQSASGATLFVEPLAVVELGNQLRQLQLAEQQEVERILRELSGLVGMEAESLTWTVEAVADLDLAFACARLAIAQQATRPTLVPLPHQQPGPVIRLLNARHPLLQGEVVPISVHLGDDFDILVITGPNTGGKTVALKTVGLLTLMAQCGLQIPADEGSQVGVFSGVYADIGDEQSIEQSLSTFSSHLSRIVRILEHAGPTALVLLDELGAGTDPQEGSALARAILGYLRDRGAYVVATTHYSELKAYAHTTPRVANASVEFDVETLSPTYRLAIGLPGRSNALAIAARLGLDPRIIEAARSLLAPAEVEVESMLRSIQEERAEAERLRAAAARAAADAEKLRRRLQATLQEMERAREQVWERARAESEEALAELRREIQRELHALRAAGADRTRVEEVAKRARALEPLSVPRAARPAFHAAQPAEVRPGAAVLVPSLGVPGTIISLSPDGQEAEVEVRGMRVRVPAAELQRAEEQEPRPAPAPRLLTSEIGARQVPLQLDLRGQRAEEAAIELDRYLNDAYLAGLKTVRIVHGKGTGAVRQAVRSLLADHPLVKSFGGAPQREGGEGATVVTLAS